MGGRKVAPTAPFRDTLPYTDDATPYNSDVGRDGFPYRAAGDALWTISTTQYTYLRDADPLVAVKAHSLQAEVLGLIAVEVERLIAEGVTTRLDCTVSVAVETNPQPAPVFVALVESNAQLFDILRLVEVVRDLAELIFKVFLARPARVRPCVFVPRVLGDAAIGTAAGARGPRVIGVGVDGDCGPFAGVYQGCEYEALNAWVV